MTILQPDFKEVRRIIDVALAEDIGARDITTELLIPDDTVSSLTFVAREPMTVCGPEIVPLVFYALDPRARCIVNVCSGQTVKKGAELIYVEGPARAILTGERVALNLLQRMCSVATLTTSYVEQVKGTQAAILDTRKTMPGLRELDKYAVRAGGGKNHRMRLEDAILIKDNHIAICGGLSEAIKRAKTGNVPIEVECETLAQMEEALSCNVDRILLDNMDVPNLKQAVTLAKGRVKLEASGNVTLQTVRATAQTGVDYISIGRLTHSVLSVDIGLDD